VTSRLSLDPAGLGSWLADQRWFRSRSRTMITVVVEDGIELATPRPAVLQVLRAAYEDGGEERYLVPAVLDGDRLREAAEGDGVWRAMVSMLAGSPRIERSSRGGLVLEPGPALAELLPGGAPEADGLTERAMGVEQSNTSVALGDRLMLKLYRLLEPGINPEVEVLAFLTERGFAHAPQVAGSMRYVPDHGEPAAAGIVQSLVHARGDAWAWMLEHLAGPTAEPRAAILAASRIGAVTVALHEALQSDPDHPDFPSRPATDDERVVWQRAAQAELDSARSAAPERLSSVADRVSAAFEAMSTAQAAWSSRIHGDYHLGQLLVTDDGFVVTDFEGEPARPLEERRRPASPLRDVAGMLRSLDYAARTAQRTQPDFDADGWLEAARGAFLTAYGEPADPALLRAFELEKACYEVRYEANFRPDWIWLPLEAIERMAA
jgi:maltokinase